MSFLAGLCYSVWLWVKKPDRIVVNSWLSGLSTVLTLGFLIVGAGWNFAGSGLVALLFGIGAVAVSASGFGDRVYVISERRYE